MKARSLVVTALLAVACSSPASDDPRQRPKPPPALPSAAPNAESAGEEPVPVRHRGGRPPVGAAGGPNVPVMPVPPKHPPTL